MVLGTHTALVRSAVFALGLIAACGCSADITDPAGVQATGPFDSEWAPAFSVEASREVRLLPFDVRMNKLANLAGVEITDPVLDQLATNRVLLGGDSYAQGVSEDPLWNATKIAAWVDALQPYCESDALRNRFPNLASDATAFATEAYARRVSQKDAASLHETFSELSAERRETLTCLAVLSSLEFVAQ